MAMSEEEIQNLNENLKQLNDTIKLMNDTMSAVTNQSTLAANATSKLKASVNNTVDDIDDLAGSTINAKGALDNLEKSTERTDDAHQSYRKGLTAALSAITGFGDALLDTTPGVAKYGDSLKSATNAAGEFASNIPMIGFVLEPIIKLFGVLGAEALKYKDVIVDSRNELYNMGAVGGITANELHTLAKTTGVTYKNLEVLIKPLKGLGTGLISIGGSVSEGVKRFIEITAVTDDVRASFYRLGLNADRLREEQADYIELQRLSGIQMSAQFISTKDLKTESLKYILNLRELAALSGKDIDTIKKEQQAIANQAQLQIRNYRLQQEEIELRARAKETGDASLEAEADRIKAMRESENALVQTGGTMGKEVSDAITEFVASGGNILSDLGARLLLWGVDLEQLRSKMQTGDLDIGSFFQQEVYSGVRELATSAAGETLTISEEFRNKLGISADLVARAIALSAVDITNLSQKAIDDILNAQGVGYDPDADDKARAQQMEISARMAFSGVVEYVEGPLFKALNFLADAAESAARWISTWVPGARDRVREEEARIRRETERENAIQELSSSISRDNPELSPVQVDEEANRIFNERIRQEVASAASLILNGAALTTNIESNTRKTANLGASTSETTSMNWYDQLAPSAPNINQSRFKPFLLPMPNSRPIQSVPTLENSTPATQEGSATSTPGPVSSVILPATNNIAVVDRVQTTNDLLIRSISVLESIEGLLDKNNRYSMVG